MTNLKIINFMGGRKIAVVISALLILGSIVSLAVKGINFGLDFTGGTEIEVHYENTPSLNAIRSELSSIGFPNAVVAHFGSDRDILIRMQTDDPKMGDEVSEHLKASAEGDLTLKRVSFVGPQIGDELRDQGGLGMLVALGIVMLYVALRFQFKFSVGAVGALAHDVIITLGYFSLFNVNFDLTVLAALLAVIGYSLNDTIVVSDRIRENFRKLRDVTPEEVINISLSQTLGRTLITSLTTLLVLLALFFVGGELIHNFALALILGVVIGTYSSVYVAANLLLAMRISSTDLMLVEKEGDEFENLEP